MPEYKFSEIMRSYLRKGCDHKSPRTIRAEASCANVLLRAFGDYWLSPDPAGSGKRKMLTGAVVRQHRINRRADGIKPSTVQRELSLASSAVQWAISEECIDVYNPFAGRTKGRGDVIAPRKRVLTVEEERRLLLAAPQPLQDMIKVYLSCGFRRSELVLLTWDRVDGNIVRFGADDHKARREGISALSPEAQAIIERQPRRGRFVFTLNGEAGPIAKSTFYSLFWGACKRAGIDGLTPHDLRRTWATRAIASGKALSDVRSQGRWATTAILERVYAQPTLTAALRAVT